MGMIHEGVVTLCIGAVGMLGNVIAIPYFGRRILSQKTFYILLLCLSICDLIVVINGMLLYGIPKVSDVYANEEYFLISPYVFPIFEMGSTGGIYFTMAICIERYFVVCRPLWYRAQAIASRTYTIPILIFSVVYNIPRFFEIRTVKIHDDVNINGTFLESNIENITKKASFLTKDESILNLNRTQEIDNHYLSKNVSMLQNFEYAFEPTELRQNVNYYGVYHIGCAITFLFILPLLVLITANILILKALIKHNYGPPAMMTNGGGERGGGFQRTMSMHQHPSQLRRRQNQVDRAKVTLAICGIFLFCHLFKWVLNIYELYIRFRSSNLSEEEKQAAINQSDWFATVVNISNTLVILNSSINFYVYVLKDGWTKFTQKGGTRENGNHSTGITNTTSLKTTFSMKPRHTNT